MKLCTDHWKKLKAAIEVRGVQAGVSEHGQHLDAKLKEEFGGAKQTKQNFDPLMNACMMIYDHALDHGGLGMLMQEENQPERCPVCWFSANCQTCAKGEVERWIEYAARDASEIYQKLPES